MSRPKSRSLAAIRDAVKGRAYLILGTLTDTRGRTIRVRARNRSLTVTITVAPAGDDQAGAPRPGRWLSAGEQVIVDRIIERRRSHPEEKLTGARIAQLASFPHDPCFKTLLRNLVDRQILTHDDQAGYDLAPS